MEIYGEEHQPDILFLKGYFSRPRYFCHMMEKDQRKSNLKSQTHLKKKNKKKREMRKNDKNNLQKSLEGARKYVGSDFRLKGLVLQGSSHGTS